MSDGQGIQPISADLQFAPLQVNNPTSSISSGGGASSGVDMHTEIASLAELKAVAPAVYAALQKSVFQSIMNDAQHHFDKMKEIDREAERY